jgi:hypothetical protein
VLCVRLSASAHLPRWQRSHTNEHSGRKRTLRTAQAHDVGASGRMCGLQISKKCLKKLTLRLAQFDHSNGRGLGGSSGGAGKRDDRIFIDGKPVNCAACLYCNAEKGSRRMDRSRKRFLERSFIPRFARGRRCPPYAPSVAAKIESIGNTHWQKRVLFCIPRAVLRICEVLLGFVVATLTSMGGMCEEN